MRGWGGYERDPGRLAAFFIAYEQYLDDLGVHNEVINSTKHYVSESLGEGYMSDREYFAISWIGGWECSYGRASLRIIHENSPTMASPTSTFTFALG